MSQTFGRYILLKKIGVGGMAVVHKAKLVGAKGFSKSVAIKMTQSHLSSDPSFVRAFEAEAKLASLLEHPNIVQVLDFGDENEVYYLAMEYVWGKDLRTVLNQGEISKKPIPSEFAAFIVSSVCQGLDYAHNMKDTDNNPLNLVHRDISPQNVLVSYGGDVKVVDFGIAKIATSSQHTQAGLIKGKVSYMSPEQTLGNPLDRRSDLFAVGIVFYELLAGKNPFQTEDNILTLDKIRKAEYTPLVKVGVKVSSAIERIIGKCLAKEPANRYQTAKDLQHDIDNYLHSLNKRVSREDIGKYMSDAFANEKKQDESERSKEDTAIRKVGTGSVELKNSQQQSEKKSTTDSPVFNWKVFAGVGVGVLALLFVVMKFMGSSGGTVKIETNPKQATVWLDGEKVGDLAPITLTNIAVGEKHEITVNAKGFKKLTKIFVLDKEERSFDLALEREASGSIEPTAPVKEIVTTLQEKEPFTSEVETIKEEQVEVSQDVVETLGQLEIKVIDSRSKNILNVPVQVNRISKGNAPVTLDNLDMSETFSVTIDQTGYNLVTEEISFSAQDKENLFKSIVLKLNRQTGKIKIVSQGGEGPFEVSIDGLSIGMTPVERGKLPVGRSYRIVAQAKGYKRYSRTISLDASETSIVVVEAERLIASTKTPPKERKGQLKVNIVDSKSGRPLDASIKVNKKSEGTGSVTLDQLDMSKRFSITVSKKGYKSVTESVTFSVKDKKRLSKSVLLKLNRLTGKLKIVAQKGKGPFEISIDGFFIGTTPIERGNLPIGRSYRIVAQADGYTKYSSSISLDKAETNTVVVTPKKVISDPPKSPKQAHLSKFSINTRPWSEVFIDGKSIGTTPIGKYELKPGTYEVKMVNAPRSLTKVAKITIKPGNELKKFFNLED